MNEKDIKREIIRIFEESGQFTPDQREILAVAILYGCALKREVTSQALKEDLRRLTGRDPITGEPLDK